jgi:hypothetical protein
MGCGFVGPQTWKTKPINQSPISIFFFAPTKYAAGAVNLEANGDFYPTLVTPGSLPRAPDSETNQLTVLAPTRSWHILVALIQSDLYVFFFSTPLTIPLGT